VICPDISEAVSAFALHVVAAVLAADSPAAVASGRSAVLDGERIVDTLLPPARIHC
jgi:hypothetical protein